MMTSAADYAFCAHCERLRLRPPAGIGGTNDVACEVCKQGYAVLDRKVTADALAAELHAERRLIANRDTTRGIDLTLLRELPGLGHKASARTMLRMRPEEKSMLIALARKFVWEGAPAENGDAQKPTSMTDVVRWLIRDAARKFGVK